MPLREALGRSEPLALLGARLRESSARLEAVRSCLPPGLSTQVLAGPLDEHGWSLLVRNASVSSKLRQLKPSLEKALASAGFDDRPIRLKVQLPDASPR